MDTELFEFIQEQESNKIGDFVILDNDDYTDYCLSMYHLPDISSPVSKAAKYVAIQCEEITADRPIFYDSVTKQSDPTLRRKFFIDFFYTYGFKPSDGNTDYAQNKTYYLNTDKAQMSISLSKNGIIGMSIHTEEKGFRKLSISFFSTRKLYQIIVDTFTKETLRDLKIQGITDVR